MSDKQTSGAIGALIRLTLADLLRTQRAILAGAMLALPVAFSIWWSYAEWITGDSIYQWGIIFSVAYLNVVIPFLALFFGVTLVSGEQESQTLVYLLTRGVSRWAIGLTKYLTAAAVCLAGLGVSMLLAWLCLILHFGAADVLSSFAWWLALAGAAAGATAVYLAIFFAAGLLFRRPVVAGVIFIVFWEGLVGLLKGVIRYGTVIHYPRSIALNASRKFEVIIPSYLTIDPVSTATAWAVIGCVTLAALVFALVWFSRAEYPTTPDR